MGPTHVVQTWILEAREVLLGKYPMPETPSNFHQALSVAKSRDPLKVAPGKRQGGGVVPWSPRAGTAVHRHGPRQPCIFVMEMEMVMESAPRLSSKAALPLAGPVPLSKSPTLSVPVSSSVK